MPEPTEFQQRMGECAKALTLATARAMTIDGKVNLPTMVAACARMGGRYLLRAQQPDLQGAQPGMAVLSAGAESQTALLVHFCATALKSLGTVLPASPPEPMDQVAARLKQDFLQSQATLEPVYEPLRARHGLDDDQMARAVATAAGALVHQFAKHMVPAAGFACAVYGFTEGLRTVPARLEPPHA